MKAQVVLLLTGLCIMAKPLCAQEHPANLSSTVPDYARFEVVQSPLLAKLTIRLDRFTGDTWQFVEDKKGDYAWQRMQRINIPNDTKLPGKVNYQIFLSGIRAQITVLMNTNTGASWYIAVDSKEGEFWNPME